MARRKPSDYPVSVETFQEPRYFLDAARRFTEPSAFNGMVHATRYRITVEIIDEPRSVVHARLQKLWDECDNMHQWGPLCAAAKAVGLELSPRTFGRRKART